MYQIDQYLKIIERIFFFNEKKRVYQHYNEELVHRNEDQMHHNDEHREVIVKMVRDYLEHHDQANRNRTNELLDEIHLSLTKIFNKNYFV
jgi:RNA polymerase-binding transcription factor DksA